MVVEKIHVRLHVFFHRSLKVRNLICHFIILQIFSSVNLQQTFQLAFQVLCKPHRNPMTLKHTVDLFVDILNCERVQNALQRCTLIYGYVCETKTETALDVCTCM